MKVLLLGYGHLGAALLDGLMVSEGCTVSGVFRWSGRLGESNAPMAYFDDSERLLAEAVKRYGLDDLHCRGVNQYDFVAQLQKRRPDVLLIGSWGEILKPHILQFPGLRVINCHPSLLPKHRGANPYVSAIRAGETQGGVTFHDVTEGIDAGAILLQQPVAIRPEETGGDLRERCAETARGMVPVLIGKLAVPGFTGTPQDESVASHYKNVTLEDGLFDWSAAPQALHNQIRALQPWMDCYGFANGRRLITFKKLAVNTVQPHGAAAGTLLGVSRETLWVASAEPTTRLGLLHYRIQLGESLLPESLSRWLAPLLLKPGQILGPRR